jgi:hypothetical protein
MVARPFSPDKSSVAPLAYFPYQEINEPGYFFNFVRRHVNGSLPASCCGGVPAPAFTVINKKIASHAGLCVDYGRTVELSLPFASWVFWCVEHESDLRSCHNSILHSAESITYRFLWLFFRPVMLSPLLIHTYVMHTIYEVLLFMALWPILVSLYKRVEPLGHDF